MLICRFSVGGRRSVLHLITGNKNHLSWSLRPWLAMKVAGIAFAETLISPEAADFKSRLAALSSAGKMRC
jgi:glutathione S-transferase